VGDSKGALSGAQAGDVGRREVAEATQALAAPPVGVRSVGRRDLVAGSELELVRLARAEVVQTHVQVGGQQPLVFYADGRGAGRHRVGADGLVVVVR